MAYHQKEPESLDDLITLTGIPVAEFKAIISVLLPGPTVSEIMKVLPMYLSSTFF